MRWRWLFLWAVSIQPTNIVEGKVVTGSFKVSPTNKDWRVHYITQFACSIGECVYRVRAGVRSPLSLVNWARSQLVNSAEVISNSNEALANAAPGRMIVRIVLDEEWEASHGMAACERAELGRGRTSVQIPLNGTYGDWARNTFRQTFRPHFWYFFAEDCKNAITEQLARATNTSSEHYEDYEIFYQIKIFQADNSHLSFEHVGLVKWNIIQACVNAIVLVYLVVKQIKVMKNQRFQLHVLVQMLNTSLGVAIIGNILQVINLSKMATTGLRFPLLEGLSETGMILSQIAVSSCLILIAMGVTLNAPVCLPAMTYSMLGVAIATAHLSVVIIDKFVSDTRFKYYTAEGPAGWILILFRVTLWALFLVFWQITRTDRRTPAATDRFLRRILLPASAYFLTFPIQLLLASFCMPYRRHAFFFHSSFILQLVAIIWLAEIFLTKGEYFQVSQMSQSFLPVSPSSLSVISYNQGGMWRPNVLPHHID